MQAIPLSNASCSPPRIFLQPQGNAEVWSRDAWASSRASKSTGSTASVLKRLADRSPVHISQMQDWGTMPPLHHLAAVQPRDSLSVGRRKCSLLESTAWRQSFWNILLVSTAETTLSCFLIQPAYILTVPLKLIFSPLVQYPQADRQIKFSFAFSC